MLGSSALDLRLWPSKHLPSFTILLRFELTNYLPANGVIKMEKYLGIKCVIKIQIDH